MRFTDFWERMETHLGSSYARSYARDHVLSELEGRTVENRSLVEESLFSEGWIGYEIQVPGDGKPIIILTELVTGGYTKIATVISMDLSKVAQLKPGDRVRFAPISVEEAHRLLREQEERLLKFKDFFEQR